MNSSVKEEESQKPPGRVGAPPERVGTPLGSGAIHSGPGSDRLGRGFLTETSRLQKGLELPEQMSTLESRLDCFSGKGGPHKCPQPSPLACGYSS